MIDWSKNVLGPTISVFGQPVDYLPKIGGSYRIKGVFDEAYREIDLAGGMGVNSVFPALGIMRSDLPFPPEQGDQLTILATGDTYVVKNPRPDSHGSVLLELNYLGA